MKNIFFTGLRNGGAVHAVILVVLCTAAVLGILYYRGYLGNFSRGQPEEESILEFSKPGKGLPKVIDSLRDIAGAQKKYLAQHGTYARLIEFLLAEGYVSGEIGLSTDPATAFAGYYFIGLSKQGPGFIDLEKGFVVAAVPARYGRQTRDTLVVGPSGRIFKKDVGPEPISDVATIDASWKEVK